MASKKIRTNKCATMAAEILAAYQQYVEFGYPKDPSIYEIRAHTEVTEVLLEYIPTIKFSSGASEWPFKVIEDDSIDPGKVTFGPERVTIEWRNNYGM